LIAALVLLVLPVLVYHGVALGRAVFAGYDHTGINQPLKMAAFDTMRKGDLPLWESRLDRGMPLLAEGEAGIFYPLNVLFFLPGDFLTMYNWVLLLVLGAAGILFYLWVRKLGAGPVASLLGAISWQWGSAVNFNKANLNILESLILAPLLLMLIEPSRDPETSVSTLKGWWMRAAGIACVVASMYFAGQAQYVVYTGLFACTYVVLRILFSRTGTRLRELAAIGFPFVAGSILGFGLTAAILLPQIELIGLSERGTSSLDPMFATTGLWLTPSRLFAAYIFPVYHVSVNQFLPYLSTAVWVGPVAILLAGHALRSKNRTAFPGLIPLLVAGLIFLYLAMGSNAPLAGKITSWGLLGHFRGHGRFAGYFGLAILTAMALGLDSLLRRAPIRRLWFNLPPFVIELGLMLVLLIPFIVGYREYLETKMALGIFLAFLILFFAGLILNKLMKSGVPIIVAISLCLIVQVFGFYATSSETILDRASWDRDRSDLLYIKDKSGTDESTFLAVRTRASIRLHENFVRHGFSQLSPGPHEHIDYLGSANAGLMDNLSVLNADLPLELSRWEWLVHQGLWSRIDSTKGELSRPDQKLLWILGVNWIVTENGDVEIPGYEKLSDPAWENQGTPYYIYKREWAIRPYMTFWNWVPAGSTDEEAVRNSFEEWVDGSPVDTTAFVEGGEGSPVAPEGTFEDHRSTVVFEKSADPTEFSAIVNVGADALFVLRDAWYPGWKVWVNDRPAELLRADLVFKAVKVPAGNNRVRFEYVPTQLKSGWTISGISAGLVLLILLIGMISRTRSRVKESTVEG
jgi:hypothetical protein